MSRPHLLLCAIAVLVWVVAAPRARAQTVDAGLQRAVSRAMAGHSGTAVVVDVPSGRVLASYRPEVAASRVAYPGSSIKPFTLLALLQLGKVDAQTALFCKRTLLISGHKLDCGHPATAQPLDPAAALAYSCNSYFAGVATRLTPVQLRDALIQAGFGSTTGWLRDEASGSVALARSAEELQLQAIGEWGIRVTPLELLHAYRGLALLLQQNEPTLTPLFDGLQQSVSYGMAHTAQSASVKVAGKTGTAPADEGSWTHAWFAGYAPANKPAIALVVFLEKGRGGTDAASVAHEIFESYAKSGSSTAMRVESPRP